MTNDLLKEAYGAMQHNRRRTTLTMLGMAWGIATVVILLAFGSGFERAINMIFSSWGTDVIGAFPGRTSLQAGGAKAGSEVRLKLADVDYIRNEVPMVKGVTPIFDKRGVTIQHDTRTFTNLFLTGVYPVYQRIRGFDVASGRGLSDQDQVEHARVVVIGDEAKRRLFSGEQALGQSIRINGGRIISNSPAWCGRCSPATTTSGRMITEQFSSPTSSRIMTSSQSCALL